MLKNYDLQIEELREFEGGHLGYWSKGHQDPNEFVMEIATNHDQGIPPIQRAVRHEWWRCVPVGSNTDETRGSLLVKAKPNTRGAFPVTVVEP